MKDTTEVSFILLEWCPGKEGELGSVEKYKVSPLIWCTCKWENRQIQAKKSSHRIYQLCQSLAQLSVSRQEKINFIKLLSLCYNFVVVLES